MSLNQNIHYKLELEVQNITACPRFVILFVFFCFLLTVRVLVLDHY
jgi:hypothetical protein